MNEVNALQSFRTPSKGAVVVDKEVKRLQCYALMGVCDVLALSAAFLLANLIYMGSVFNVHGVTMLTALGPIYVGIAALHHAYNAETISVLRYGVIRSLRVFAFAAAAIMFIAYFLKAGSDFSRAVFAIGASLSILFLPLARLALRRPMLNMLGGSPFATVVILDGASYSNDTLHDVVITSEQLDFDPATKDPLRFHRLAHEIGDADRVIVACPPERARLWASVLKSLAVDGEIVSNELDDLGIIAIRQHGTHRMLVVATGPLELHQRVLKRVFDLFVSVSALLVLSPLFIAVAIAIRVDSPGPILFRQERVGRHNRIFKVFKFRSMYAHMSDASAIRPTGRTDERVTRVGAFIRSTSIDELPQLINVLRGEMSIVGPRPHALSSRAADKLFWDVDPRYRHRHAIKPGITGLAQVRGYRGTTARTEDLTNRLQADLEYAADWTIWRDLRLIFQTFFVMRHHNAF